MFVRLLDWIASLSKSKGLDLFNKLWMVVTLLVIVLMLVGNYFQLGATKPTSGPPTAASTVK
jgi:hypothetical protein